jgi:hypothetical protein
MVIEMVVIYKLKHLSFLVGFVGMFLPMLYAEAVQAQSTVEKRLCRYSGQYVVFAI